MTSLKTVEGGRGVGAVALSAWCSLEMVGIELVQSQERDRVF